MDYHIYIHSKGGTGGSVSPTMPKQNESPTSPKEKSVFGVIRSGVNFLKSAPSASSLASFYVGYKIVDKAMSFVAPYVSRETGYYEFYRQWSTGRNVINAVLNPIGTVKNFLQYNQNMRLDNMRRDEQRVLLGDSVLSKTIRRI